MITLPEGFAPNECEAHIVSFDIHARPSTGAAVQTIYRPGSRFALDIGFPAMMPARARILTSRLTRAEREGLRMKVPLIGVSQGSPGTPLVNGDYPSGTVLPLKGCTPGYLFDEGYWLTLIGGDGSYYLHRVVGSAIVNGSGEVTLSVETPIRAPFLDGAAVLAATPMVEGFIENGSLSLGRAGPDRRVSGIGFRLEEYA